MFTGSRRANDFFFFRPGSRVEKRVLAATSGEHRQRLHAVSPTRAIKSGRRILMSHDRAGPSYAVANVSMRRARDLHLETAFARLHGCRHLGPHLITRHHPPSTDPNGATQREYKNTPESRAAAAARRHIASEGG